MGFKEWIIPQDKVFFGLLEKQTTQLQKILAQFRALLGDWDHLEAQRLELKAVENDADATAHELFERLNQTFITPIDREDLARLAHVLDDIIDAIYAAGNRLVLFEVEKPTEEMGKFIDILDGQAKEITAAVALLRRPGALAKELPPRVIEIHRLENDADRLLNRVTADLFRHPHAVYILKHKEVYEYLEAATDRCEDVANVLQDILRKHG